MFNVHHHRLLKEPAQRTKQTYLAASPENALWQTEFRESYAVYILPIAAKSTPHHKCPMAQLFADGSGTRAH